MEIRLVTKAEAQPAAAVIAAAFNRPMRVDELLRCVELQPDGCFIALLDDRVVGTVEAVDFGSFAYLGLMTVDPARRRLGIGRALMERVLGWLDGRGTPAVLLDATPMGYPLYASLGFQDRDEARTFQAPEPGCLVAPEDGKVQVQALTPGDLDEVLAFDAEAFGAERGVLWRSYLRDHPGRAFFTRGAGGQVNGCLMARPRSLGPWTASDPEAARALLRAALELEYESPPTVVVPGVNVDGGGMLESCGFTLQRSIRHMQRGGPAHRRREWVYGQASYALG